MKPLIVHALESLLLTSCMWKTHVPSRLVIEDPPLPSVMPHGSLLQALPVVTLNSQELRIKPLLLCEDSAEARQWKMSLQLHCAWEVYFV